MSHFKFAGMKSTHLLVLQQKLLTRLWKADLWPTKVKIWMEIRLVEWSFVSHLK